jgi:hypothetical protein
VSRCCCVCVLGGGGGKLVLVDVRKELVGCIYASFVHVLAHVGCTLAPLGACPATDEQVRGLGELMHMPFTAHSVECTLKLEPAFACCLVKGFNHVFDLHRALSWHFSDGQVRDSDRGLCCLQPYTLLYTAPAVQLLSAYTAPTYTTDCAQRPTPPPL